MPRCQVGRRPTSPFCSTETLRCNHAIQPMESTSSRHPAPAIAPHSAVLFLDFDGVLQTPALAEWQEMEHCSELATLLERLPRLSLVVTSTPREGKSLVDLRHMLPQAIAPRVIGATPVSALGRASGGRQAEIEAWLTDHKEVVQWAAVDDEPHLYGQDCPWLVATHPCIGWDSQTSGSLLQAFGHISSSQPTMTGKCVEPRTLSASHRCLPSMNTSPASSRVKTGSAGQSARLPAAASSNHRTKYASLSESGNSGASIRASLARALDLIWTTCTGPRTKS